MSKMPFLLETENNFPSAAYYVNNIVCQQPLSKGLALTPRISPGYGDWAFHEQGIVFALLPGDKIGVTLTEKYMMRPRKSVSFATGMGDCFTIEKNWVDAAIVI